MDVSNDKAGPARTPAPRAGGKRGYGIDEPRTILKLAAAGILAVATGFIISAYTATSNPALAEVGLLAGPSVGFLILVLTAALYWSSRLGKPREMAKVIESLPWGGGEVVLDLGCGRGMGAVLAAKKLDSGYGVGVDVWSKDRLTGNGPQSFLANATGEEVSSRLSPVKGSSVQLPIADSTVDVIISGVAVHHMAPRKEREAIFSEIARVLKEGGRVGILDAGNGDEYSRLLEKTGLRDIQFRKMRFSGFPPFHIVMARKPYRG